jgi:DNA-binding NtrC family response regulator
MHHWQIVPEIAGCSAGLRIASTQAMDAVDQGRHFVVEGESGSGRRLLARSAWLRRVPDVRSLFTLDCRILGDNADDVLFGRRDGSEFRCGRLNFAQGVLLLHAETLPRATQQRLAQLLERYCCRPPGEGLQVVLTSAPAALDEELTAVLLRVHLPPLRERMEDLRTIANSFLRAASPYEAVRCSQALLDRFRHYEWPGNIAELRAVLRRMLLLSHNGLLDVGHLDELTMRDGSGLDWMLPVYATIDVHTAANRSLL